VLGAFDEDDQAAGELSLAAVLATLNRPAWQADAACREHPELTWFPERGERTEAAKQVCRRCLVRDECLNFALELGEPVGTWGGLSGQERKQLTRGATASAKRLAAA